MDLIHEKFIPVGIGNDTNLIFNPEGMEGL